MPLNLLSAPWIPVLAKDGTRQSIAPWQMADTNIDRLDWPRPDLNIACLEMLIGLVFLADPPSGNKEWRTRKAPEPDRLREKLTPYIPAFNVTGEGPLFLQDFEQLQGAPGPVDMLYIDSAGTNTAKKNADLMVHRGRYNTLDPGHAAMALYTLQAHAPSGGQGNRTSMRGGGPMVTLIDPGEGLWSLIWANVPNGTAGDMAALPWMKPTQISKEKGSERYCQQGIKAEAFFGMPRRLRLVVEDDRVTGVIQRPHGANYAGWQHPLTPYYRIKEGTELLPKHPKPGAFGYRNWLGVVMSDKSDALTERAEVLRLWTDRTDSQQAHLIVAGWAMNKMTPVDFIWSEPPVLRLEDDGLFLRGLIHAADKFRESLRSALGPVLGKKGHARDTALEAFSKDTEVSFETHIAQLAGPSGFTAKHDIATAWVKDMRGVALSIFDRAAVPGLPNRLPKTQKKIVEARLQLLAAFQGRKGLGAQAFSSLELEPIPAKKAGLAE